MTNKEKLQNNNERMTEANVFDEVRGILKDRGVSFVIYEHEPLYTMEQTFEVCGNLPEQEVKTLFARKYETKNKYGYCLIVWSGNKKVDFLKVANSLGVKKVSLATSDEVRTELGIEIGALSPFGYPCSFSVVMDGDLLRQSEVFINPGVHNRTIKLAAVDLGNIIETSTLDFHLV